MTTRVSPGHPIRVISRLRSPNHREYAYCSQRSRADPFPPHSLENVGDAELRVIKHAILADREATTGIEPVWTALQRVEFRAYELFAGSLSSARCSEFCSVL